jgi:rhodanese-related sulfurtransferase
MKSLIFFPVLVALLAVSACSDRNTAKKTDAAVVAVSAPVTVDKETSLLLKDFEDHGDYVNSKEFPSLIKSSLVFDNLGKNMLVIDLRPTEDFRKGHIKDAVNKRFEDLPGYFETGIKPFEFSKIILVSEDGQQACYTTCLLRLMGYGNVYAMRWGMSGWNKKMATDGWLKGISGKYEKNLELTVNPVPPATGMPALHTGKATGEEIGLSRFDGLFKAGTGNIMISADEVFAHPEKYYIINYERKDKYENGHIPGAVRYKPDGMLGIISELATIPQDKPVVVYCGTGHNSGFVTAYLRLFGYDARTLSFGNNGFMYNKMVEQKTALSWLPFTLEESHDYPLVK